MLVLNGTFAQIGLKIPKLTHNSWAFFFYLQTSKERSQRYR